MSFVQKFFTSYGKFTDGETRTGELNRLWYDSNTNTIRIGDGTAGGKIVSGAGLGSNVHEGAVPPSSPPPTAGDMWWNTEDGNLYIYYDNNWVAANSYPTPPSVDLTNYATHNYVTDAINNIVFPTDDDSSYATQTFVTTAIGNIVFPPTDRIISSNTLHSTVIDNDGITTSGGDIVPGASTYSLGTITNPWKDVFISQGSIVIANTDPTVDGVNISNTDRYIVIDQGGLKVTANDETHEVFQLDNTGKLILKSEQPGLTTTAALDLIGNLLGTTLPTNNLGVMLHATGTQDQPSRIYLDGIGTQGSGQSAYAAYIGRYARGTVESPLPAEAGDILARFGGNAHSATLGLNTISNVRVDMVATEQQTDAGRGSRMEFWTTPIGSIVPQRSVHIDSQGIDLSESTDINAGIVFKNGSLLKYWPSQTGNTGKILRTDGTDFFWDSETVPTGIVLFKGDWSAANPPGGGTPTISDATGELGWQWIVNAAGTQDLGSGDITFAVGDLVIHNGTRYIKIEATTPQVQADWTETNTALPAYIKHKPTLATVATSGSYNDLGNKPYIPAAQVNSDWNATTGLAQILNKPSIPTQYTDTLARGAISLTSNTPSGTTSTLTYVGGVFTFTSAAAPTAPVNADWNATTGLAQILNKPSIPAAQIQSDWNQSNNASLDYIKNKPTLTNGTVTSVGGTGTVSGLTLTGTVTSTGNLTLGGTLSLTSGNVTTALGFTPYSNANPSGYTTNTGTVTSITASTTPVNGLSLSGGAISTSGTIAITGTLSGITNTNLSGTAGITNANLANSSVTVTAGTGMSGGGAVSLGGSITLTNAGVTSAVAGTGIGVSGSTGAVTITNTGVTSIVAGTNVTVSGATGAVTINASAGVGGNQLVFVLDAVLNLASAKNTLASIFGLTSGVTVTSNTRYQYELVFNVQANKTGVLSYALALGSSAAVAQHNYTFEGNTTTTISGYTAGVSMMSANATGAAITTAQTVADTLNGFAHYIVCGTIDVTTGGTVNFMISQDQNTPITWSVKPGAYIKLTPLGAIGANTVAGTWA